MVDCIAMEANVQQLPADHNCNDKTMGHVETEQFIRKHKENLLQRLGQVCLWCFSYSKRKTLDCLRRTIVGRFLFLQQYMCLMPPVG